MTTVDVHAIDRAHAKLSASGSEKWMTCTPSARLEEDFPDEGSEFAREGTFAHEVFELQLKRYLHRVSTREFDAGMAILKDNEFWSEELRDHVQDAVNVAIERIELARERSKDAIILVEQRLDFSPWVPEGFGTGDLVIVADDLLEVLDLKFGKGIPVSAIENSQMRLYGLGAVNALAHLYDVQRVRATILQPRLENYSSEELTFDELLRWGEDKVKPRAKLAWLGEGEFAPGDHCTSCFCKARYTCAARAKQGMAIAKASFALVEPELLTTEQIVSVLDKADLAIKWLKDVQDFALSQAERGSKIPGYKLVEGRSNRKYTNADAVAIKLQQAGIPVDIIFERSLLGITAMEKAIGKKKFEELLGGLVEKPQGKPTLVPESDKRPEFKSNHGFTAIAEDRS